MAITGSYGRVRHLDDCSPISFFVSCYEVNQRRAHCLISSKDMKLVLVVDL